MVMVRRDACDIGVLAVREVDALDGADSLEHLDHAEDGGPPDAKTALLDVGQEVGGREGAVAGGDQVGEGAPRPGQAVAGGIEDIDEITWLLHGGDGITGR